MKSLTAFILLINAVTVAKADIFDDKARAQAAQRQQEERIEAHTARYNELVNDNASIIGRVPRGAAITQCFDFAASIYRDEPNGCWLENIEWNGVPVQICTEGYDRTLPPRITQCHYHVEKTNRDCKIVLNSRIKPVCL